MKKEIIDPKTIFDVMCETNNNLVKRGEQIKLIVVYFKDGIDTLHELKTPKNYKYEKVAGEIRNIAKLNGVDAYIVIYEDIILHKWCIRTLYTPTNKIMDVIKVEADNTIINHDRIHGRNGAVDKWDAWPVHAFIVHVDLDKNKPVKEKNNSIKSFIYKKNKKK